MNIDLSIRWEKTVLLTGYFFKIRVKRIALQKVLLVLPLQKEVLLGVVAFLNAAGFIKEIDVGTLSVKTPTVLFEYPFDIWKSLRWIQLVLDSELNKWHRKASFVPYGQLLSDFLPVTDDRQPRCMNSCSIATECYYAEPLTHSIWPDGYYAKPLKSLTVAKFFTESVKVISFCRVRKRLPGFYASVG